MQTGIQIGDVLSEPQRALFFDKLKHTLNLATKLGKLKEKAGDKWEMEWKREKVTRTQSFHHRRSIPPTRSLVAPKQNRKTDNDNQHIFYTGRFRKASPTKTAVRVDPSLTIVTSKAGTRYEFRRERIGALFRYVVRFPAQFDSLAMEFENNMFEY